MSWYVRFGPGLVAPRSGDPPRKRRGWKLIAPLAQDKAVQIGMEKTAEGLAAEAGEFIAGKCRARYRPADFRERGDPRR